MAWEQVLSGLPASRLLENHKAFCQDRGAVGPLLPARAGGTTAPTHNDPAVYVSAP